MCILSVFGTKKDFFNKYNGWMWEFYVMLFGKFVEKNPLVMLVA